MRSLKILSTVLIAALVLFGGDVSAQKRKDRKKLFANENNYEISSVKVGQEGTKLVKVWGYGKKADQAVVQAKKNAVHAVIFRGLPGSATVPSTPPLCKDPQAWDKHREYFESFFETAGPYLTYVNQTTDGVPSGTDRLKIKGGYKVGIYAQVMYDNLRKRLEADGIIKKLNSGF